MVSASTRSENSRETDFFITDGAEHVLEEELDVVLAFAIEEADYAGDEGGADIAVVRIGGERVWLVETGDRRELGASVGKAGLGGVVVVGVEGGRVGKGAQAGRGPEERDRGRAECGSHGDLTSATD